MIYIYRDLGFFIMSLLLYDLILYKGIIYLSEAVMLLCFVFLYIFVITRINRTFEEQKRQSLIQLE